MKVTTWPIFAFGVLFFIAGHLIESTTVPLEIYFPQRNYVPAFGVFFAVFYAAFFLPRNRAQAQLAALAVFVYTVATMFVAQIAISLWGEPVLSRIMWLHENPTSIRARQAMIGTYISLGDEASALELLNETIRENPGNEILVLQRLRFCAEEPNVDERIVSEAVSKLGSDKPLTFAAAELLAQYAAFPLDDFCNGRFATHFNTMLNLAFERIERFPSRTVHRTLLAAKAQYLVTSGDFETARAVLREASFSEPDLEMSGLIADLYLAEHNVDAARSELLNAKQSLAKNSLQNWIAVARLQRWLDQLDGR